VALRCITDANKTKTDFHCYKIGSYTTEMHDLVDLVIFLMLEAAVDDCDNKKVDCWKETMQCHSNEAVLDYSYIVTNDGVGLSCVMQGSV